MKLNLRKVLVLSLVMVMVLAFTACGKSNAPKETTTEKTETTENAGTKESTESKEVLKVGMECMYAPYNWTQSDDSNGAVKIEGSNEYANGYDVVLAKKVAEGLGKELVVVKTEWEGLPPAVQTGKIDVIMAGMSPTAERKENIDFSSPYWESDLVVIVKKDSPYINAKSINDFKGAKITGQLNTVHYDVIDQMEGVNKVEPMGDFMQERVALDTGKIDAYVAETPEGISVEAAMPGLTYITFAEGQGFKTDATERQISAGFKKGSDLVEKVSEIIDKVTEEERQQIMEEAIKNQPVSQ